MTLTAMNEAAEAPAAGLAGPVGPASGKQAERFQAQLFAAQLKQQERAAEEKRRQDRLDAEEKRRQDRARERDDRRAERRRDRAEARSALVRQMSEHATNLMVAPLIAVPGWLGWDAMSEFGAQLYGGPGHALPVLSEAGMWLFDFAVIRARRENPGAAVWPLYGGMAFFAAVCAALNFSHGDLGPIPGKVPPGIGAGLVYALVSISGIIAHQIVEFGARKKAATNKAAAAEVAPQDEKVAPEDSGATNAPEPRHLTGPDGRHLLPVVAVSGPSAGRTGGGATKDDLDRATADLDRAVAARKRAERENAELRQQLADALRGDSEKDSGEGAKTTAKRGDKQTMMRAYWEKEIAAGNIPNGADLNRAAGNDPGASLGRRYASEWRDELPSEFTGNQQEAGTHEESTTTVLAGAA
jgi:hypothetical protein